MPINDTIGHNLTTERVGTVKYDIEEIQQRMNRNQIINPCAVQVDKARLDLMAATDRAKRIGNDSIRELKGIFNDR